MNKVINYENLRSFAYSNDKLIKGDIKAVCLDFFGLGCQAMYHEDTKTGIMMAENNVLFVVPYANPWGWMNRQEIDLTDEILDVLFEKYNLPETTPIASTGGSMGGLCCLAYTYYAKRTPSICVANCPVCDLPFHFTERVDLPRTIYSAFYLENGELDEVLMRYSPLHLAEKMPKIKYAIFHCDADDAYAALAVGYAHPADYIFAVLMQYGIQLFRRFHILNNNAHHSHTGLHKHTSTV